MAQLELLHASKAFGKRKVLKEVSFSLKGGTILGVFGSNGSGKTTLLNLMFGTLKGGSVGLRLDGKDVSTSEVIKNNFIGYVPQHPFLPAHLKVREVIPVFHPGQQKQDALFYDPVIAKISSQKVNELSQGERKYLEVLMVGNLSHNFLFLDEPFTMLEPLQIEAVSRFLLDFKTTKGIIITDHYYKDVLAISDENKVLIDGSLHSVNSEEDLRKFDYLRK